MKGLSWGLSALDRVLGPLHPGRVHVIGARPGNGKTSFALHWIDNHARTVERAFESGIGFWDMPRRVAVFLTERSPEIARLSWAAFRLGYDIDAATVGDWENLPRGARAGLEKELDWIEEIETKQGWVTFNDLSRPTVGSIRDFLSDVETRTGAGPHAILFDYIQRIKPTGRESRFDAIAEGAHLFQSLAVDSGMLVMVTSQLKRNGDRVFDKYRPPSMEDYKMAGDIEEVADVALGFFRPLQRMTMKEEREVKSGTIDLEGFKVSDVMAVKCVKHRWRGPANDKILWVRHADGKIGDMTAPQYGTGDAWEPDDSTPF